MKIDKVRLVNQADRARLAAWVTWEDTPRPPAEIYFESESRLADGMADTPDPFLAASLTPALWARERRIRVEGEVCPELVENLRTAAKFFQHWFPQTIGDIQIEAKVRRGTWVDSRARRAAFFFSGGIDSLATLRSNRLDIPLDHPGSIQDGLIIFGLEIEDTAAFARVVESLAAIAAEARVTLIPVASNVRALNPDWLFWWNAHMGPALCSVALAFGRRLASALIASDYDVRHLRPHGSHPLVEPYFGSHEVKIRYDGITLTRLEKTRLLADWDVVLRHLRVCNNLEYYRPGQLNCGECEKCVRTMLALMVVGALDRTPAFPKRELTADTILEKTYIHDKVLCYYEELVAPLRAIGRADLARALQYKIDVARGEIGWRGKVRRYDRLRLNGSLMTLKRTVLPP